MLYFLLATTSCTIVTLLNQQDQVKIEELYRIRKECFLMKSFKIVFQGYSSDHYFFLNRHQLARINKYYCKLLPIDGESSFL